MTRTDRTRIAWAASTFVELDSKPTNPEIAAMHRMAYSIMDKHAGVRGWAVSGIDAVIATARMAYQASLQYSDSTFVARDRAFGAAFVATVSL